MPRQRKSKIPNSEPPIHDPIPKRKQAEKKVTETVSDLPVDKERKKRQPRKKKNEQETLQITEMKTEKKQDSDNPEATTDGKQSKRAPAKRGKSKVLTAEKDKKIKKEKLDEKTKDVFQVEGAAKLARRMSFSESNDNINFEVDATSEADDDISESNSSARKGTKAKLSKPKSSSKNKTKTAIKVETKSESVIELETSKIIHDTSLLKIPKKAVGKTKSRTESKKRVKNVSEVDVFCEDAIDVENNETVTAELLSVSKKGSTSKKMKETKTKAELKNKVTNILDEEVISVDNIIPETSVRRGRKNSKRLSMNNTSNADDICPLTGTTDQLENEEMAQNKKRIESKKDSKSKDTKLKSKNKIPVLTNKRKSVTFARTIDSTNTTLQENKNDLKDSDDARKSFTKTPADEEVAHVNEENISVDQMEKKFGNANETVDTQTLLGNKNTDLTGSCMAIDENSVVIGFVDNKQITDMEESTHGNLNSTFTVLTDGQSTVPVQNKEKNIKTTRNTVETCIKDTQQSRAQNSEQPQQNFELNVQNADENSVHLNHTQRSQPEPVQTEPVQNIEQDVQNSEQDVPKPQQKSVHLNDTQRTRPQSIQNTEQSVHNTEQSVHNTEQDVPNTEQDVPNIEQDVPKPQQKSVHLNDTRRTQPQSVQNTEQSVHNTEQSVHNTEQDVPNTEQDVPKPQQKSVQDASGTHVSNKTIIDKQDTEHILMVPVLKNKVENLELRLQNMEQENINTRKNFFELQKTTAEILEILATVLTSNQKLEKTKSSEDKRLKKNSISPLNIKSEDHICHNTEIDILWDRSRQQTKTIRKLQNELDKMRVNSDLINCRDVMGKT